jgi:ABC-type oligopeptide transport system substrate-binding subunit
MFDNLRINVSVEPMSLLGRDALKLFGNTLYSAVFGHFFYKAGDTAFEPQYFASWACDTTFRTWTFELADDIVFHDGRKAEIEDVEFSLTRFLLNPDNLVEKSLISSIRGTRDAIFLDGWRSGAVTGIEILSKRHIKVSLYYPHPRFLSIFEHSTISLTPREHIDADGITWTGMPVGAGRYHIVAVNEDATRVTVKRVERSTDDKSPQTIEFSTGPDIDDVDFLLEGHKDVTATRRQPLATGCPASITGIFFDYRTDLGRSREFRRAIAAAVDRVPLCSTLTFSKPAFGILPSRLLSQYELDENLAMAAAKEMPSEEGSKRLKVEVARYKLNDPENSWFSVLQSQLRTAGFDVEWLESACKFFDQDVLTNPFWIVRFIPSSRDPVALFGFFIGGGSWIFPATAINDCSYLLDLQSGMQTSEHGELAARLQSLIDIFAEQTRGLPLMENEEVYSFDRDRIFEWAGAFQSGTIYFDRLRMIRPV